MNCSQCGGTKFTTITSNDGPTSFSLDKKICLTCGYITTM